MSPRFLAVALLLPLATLAPARSLGAPLGPAGAHPALAAPPTGTVDLYATAGLPTFGLGADVGLGPVVTGLELSALTPGAFRPELHARWPLDLGPVRLAPRLALAYSAALADTWRGGTIAGPDFELGAGLILAWNGPRFGLYLDGGLLGASNLERKAQNRLVATFAAGAAFAVTSRFSLAAHLGALATEAALRPAGGVTLAFRANPAFPLFPAGAPEHGNRGATGP